MIYLAAFLLAMYHAPKADIGFQFAVESFVMSAEPRSKPPERFRRLIEDLNDDCYVCRQAASWTLEKASRNDLRWLFWGRLHPVAEVRLRCNRILRRLTQCSECDGLGVCVAFVFSGTDDMCRRCKITTWWHSNNIENGTRRDCVACSGTGGKWFKGDFE